MRLGVLSDVHANAPALEATLSCLDAIGVDMLVHAGDVVGYNPYPNEVINLLIDYDVHSIRGNHDQVVIDGPSDAYGEEFEAMIVWTREHLDENSVTYLEGLPHELVLLDGYVRVVHGSPADPDEYIHAADVSEDLLGDETVLIHGHTHYQSLASFRSGLVFNPGSVGQSRDFSSLASFALLDVDTTSVQFQRVAYAVDDVKRRIQQAGLPIF